MVHEILFPSQRSQTLHLIYICLSELFTKTLFWVSLHPICYQFIVIWLFSIRSKETRSLLVKIFDIFYVSFSIFCFSEVIFLVPERRKFVFHALGDGQILIFVEKNTIPRLFHHWVVKREQFQYNIWTIEPIWGVSLLIIEVFVHYWVKNLLFLHKIVKCTIFGFFSEIIWGFESSEVEIHFVEGLSRPVLQIHVVRVHGLSYLVLVPSISS